VWATGFSVAGLPSEACTASTALCESIDDKCLAANGLASCSLLPSTKRARFILGGAEIAQPSRAPKNSSLLIQGYGAGSAWR